VYKKQEVTQGQFNEIIIKVIILLLKQHMTNAAMHSDFTGTAFRDTELGSMHALK
jgi:hypothetical protein